MKNLDLNQMEVLEGGTWPSEECLMSMGLHAMVGGMVAGPWGFGINAAFGYFTSDECA